MTNGKPYWSSCKRHIWLPKLQQSGELGFMGTADLGTGNFRKERCITTPYSLLPTP
ncbi:hypothetical protein [Moorena sp. SIO4A1]|uniref:hypothetical protein n=1 Tax=Moorena sp. SIO4A1 TaxID=2607835 RepID=UPI0025EB52B1|nr:hypothetical protein [Moorena sp. SIO4A1]